jgi:hypothetical protein
MKLRFSNNYNGYEFGIYAVNWGVPIANQWEVGIHLFKWSIGLELYRN